MSKWIKGPAGRLAVDDGGAGAGPVVFAHSLAGTAAHWSAQLDHVRTSRRAVAFDFRGHGSSERPKDGEYGMAALANDIGAVVDTLMIDRFTLVGHSMGAGVALTYAGAHPERVVRLLLLDSIGDGTQIAVESVQPFLSGLDSPAYQETIEDYWATTIGPNADVRERLMRDLRATPRDSVVKGFKSVLRFDPKPALEIYRGPALAVVTPSNDFPFSIHRLKGGPPHRVIDGTGHWIQLDKPAEVSRILDQFLEREKRSEKVKKVKGEG